MTDTLVTGSFGALITPFNTDRAADFGAFRSLLSCHQMHGTSAVLIMGSTGGESSMRSQEERRQIIVECATMNTPGMPIFFGCTGNNTDATIANVRFAKMSGTDGAILAAPAYVGASADDIEAFFLDVAEATDLPLGLYNNPPPADGSALGTPAPNLRAPQLRGTQGINRAGGPGCSDARRQAQRFGDVLRQAPPSGWSCPR